MMIAMNARKKRRGMALLLVVFLVAILSLLVIQISRSILVGHKRVHQSLRQTQAIEFAESSLRRAIAKRKSDPQYQGETWTPGSEDTSGEYLSAEIEIISVEGNLEVNIISNVGKLENRRASFQIQRRLD